MFVHAVALWIPVFEHTRTDSGAVTSMPQVYINGRSLYIIGRHGNRDRYSVDPGAVTQDVVVYIRYKRSPWCLKGGKVTVTVTQSLVCPRIRQRENRGMQRHPISKSGPTTGSTAARLGKTRTARKIRADTVNMTRAYGTVSRVANGTEVHPTRTLIFAAEVPTSCHSYLGRAKLIIYSRTYNSFFIEVLVL